MAKAYLVGMIKVTNMDGMGPYMAAVEDTITEHGGKKCGIWMRSCIQKMTLIPLLW